MLNTLVFIASQVVINGGFCESPVDGGTAQWSCTFVPDQVVTQCSDGVDNDGDGLIDLNDPGCVDASDDDEFNAPPALAACEDGVDNDGDGLVDMADPGCTGPSDNDEFNAPIGNAGFNFEEITVEVPINEAGTFGIIAYDFNRNGRLEFVTNTHNGTAQLNLWEWDGTQIAYVNAYDKPQALDTSMFTYDVDGDGYVDLVGTNPNWNPTKVIFNTPSGLDFTLSAAGYCGSNLNCVKNITAPDGAQYMLATNGNLFESGSPTATLFTSPGTSSLTGYYIDIDNDLALEYVDLTSFIPSDCFQMAYRHTQVADFDGDGDDDLFTWSAGSGQSFCSPHYLENDNGVLVERLGRFDDITSPVSTYHHSYGNTEAADIDNDGDIDLLVAGNTYSDIYKVLLNDGTGSFSRVVSPIDNIRRDWPNNNFRPQVKTVDLDLDGCKDIVVSIGESPVLRGFRSVACD